MDRPPSNSKPLSRAYEITRDIDAVVRETKRRTGQKQVALLGWATGGMWAAYYASFYPEAVGDHIMPNALYGGSDRHPGLGAGSPNADPAHPDRLNPSIGGYAVYDAASLWPSWDKSIAIENKAEWRDPNVARAYAKAALASDSSATSRNPPAFRAPTGAIEDSFYQASGRRLFDASSITSPILVVRSERDFWSRPEDVEAFKHDAVRAVRTRVVTIADATHYVHFDGQVSWSKCATGSNSKQETRRYLGID
jgi:pimeloyl-ACP methyl ester carboxylesterase